MQHSTRQPASQPDYLAVETYEAEQSRPASEQNEAQQFVPRIVVYANRLRAAAVLSAMTSRMVITGLILVPVAYIINSALSQAIGNSTLLPLYLLVLVEALIFLDRVAARLVAGRSLLGNDEPLLLITSEGISARSPLLLRNVSLAWSEITAIEVYNYKYRYLCIRPRDPRLLTRQLSWFERALSLNSLFFSRPLLLLAPSYLDKPVEEILQQLYHIYAKELNFYQIQMRS